MANPLDKLTAILARLMGKEPSDPDVLKAVVEVVMAIRPVKKPLWTTTRENHVREYLDALLTEGKDDGC